MAVVSRKKPVKEKAGLKKLDKSAPPVAKEKTVYTLPTKMTVPSTDLRDYSMLLSGEKKIGKTTLMSMFPDTFVMLAEPGGKSLRMYAAPVTSWKAAVGYLTALEADDAAAEPRFKYVGVDTIDRLAAMCEKAVCKRLGIDHPSEEEWGKGWGAVKDEFTTFMNRLLALNKGIVLTSHAAEKDFKKGQNTITRVVTTLPKWAAEIIEGLVDMWFHYAYDDEARVLTIRGDENIAAGHRLQHNFQTPDGGEVRTINMGPNKEAGYRNLLDAFANTYAPSGSAPAAAAPKPTLRKKFKVTR
jgi:hypothetical protein